MHPDTTRKRFLTRYTLLILLSALLLILLSYTGTPMEEEETARWSRPAVSAAAIWPR